MCHLLHDDIRSYDDLPGYRNISIDRFMTFCYNLVLSDSSKAGIREVRCMRLKSIGALALLFGVVGCVATLQGTVSTANYGNPPQEHFFIVIPQDSLSLTERNISSLIEAQMSKHGYKKASSLADASVAVLYKYSFGSGRTHVSSSPDFVWGGQKVESSTTYPRFFQIALVDIKKSKIPEKFEIIWQGEIYSTGSSTNISKLAVHFLDVLFQNYGLTVTNKSFYKVVEW